MATWRFNATSTREIDGGHSAAADLAQDLELAGHRVAQAVDDTPPHVGDVVSHRLVLTEQEAEIGSNMQPRTGRSQAAAIEPQRRFDAVNMRRGMQSSVQTTFVIHPAGLWSVA